MHPASAFISASSTTLPQSIIINGYQLRDALSLIAPEGTPQQMETTVCIQPGPRRITSQGVEPAGLYCWLEEYPEEGSVRLDENPRDIRLAVPHDERIVNVAQKLLAAARWTYGNPEARAQPDARALAKIVLRLIHPILNAHADTITSASRLHHSELLTLGALTASDALQQAMTQLDDNLAP